MYRFCAVCKDKFTSIESVRDHVGLRHRHVKFSEEIESLLIWDVISEWCGGAQRWEAMLVPELERVFGRVSPLSYLGPDLEQPSGEVKPKPDTYYLALVRACFNDNAMLDMDVGMDFELSEMANQVD